MALIHRDCLFEISWQSYTNWWDVIREGTSIKDLRRAVAEID